uniref:TLC domain-containing protein n=1 Tax=Mola mola TaxID=94237 RepID=A0A3Q3VU66_MOLML
MTVSTFHALLVGIFCLCILLFDDAVNEDPVWGDPTMVKTNVMAWNCRWYIGFMLADLNALLSFFFGQGMLPYFANFRLLAEFSTPCVNQRWFFEVLGYPKTSRPNMANGVVMALVFFMVRIAVMPVYYSRMYAVYGTEAFYMVPWGGRIAWICSSICLDIMNIMWMHKIARGCYKVLRSARQSKAGTPQENGKTD